MTVRTVYFDSFCCRFNCTCSLTILLLSKIGWAFIIWFSGVADNVC